MTCWRGRSYNYHWPTGLVAYTIITDLMAWSLIFLSLTYWQRREICWVRIFIFFIFCICIGLWHYLFYYLAYECCGIYNFLLAYGIILLAFIIWLMAAATQRLYIFLYWLMHLFIISWLWLGCHFDLLAWSLTASEFLAGFGVFTLVYSLALISA